MIRRTISRLLRTGVCIFLVLLFVFPIVLTFCTSFMSSGEIEKNYRAVMSQSPYVTGETRLTLIPEEVTTEQYGKILLQSPDYLQKFWNSVLLVVPITVFQLFVALLAAYWLSRTQSKARTLVFLGYLVLLLLPYQVTLVTNYFAANWIGFLNTRWAIILPGIFSPFSVYLLTKEMRRIPKRIFEAAYLDGASHWQLFQKICVPLCKGSLVGIGLLVYFDYWSMVEQPLIMLQNEWLHPLSVFLGTITAGDFGVSFAAAIVYMIPCLLLFLYGEEDLCECNMVGTIDG